MNDTHNRTDIGAGGYPQGKPRKKGWRILKWTAIVMAVSVCVPMLLITALSLYLTPERLTAIVNREASKYLNADIKADSVEYSIWSTFPRFRISTGHVAVNSRTLRGIPCAVRRRLPANADFLGSLDSFSGEINVIDLFLNRYVIHDVRADGLKINLVAYNDSINNYDILPSSGEKMKRVPYISANRISLKNPGAITYFSASTDTRAVLRLASLNLTRLHGRHLPSDTYRLEFGGILTASSAGLKILDKFPFFLGGRLNLRFNPFGVEMSDYNIDLGEIRSKLSMSVGIGEDPKIESFNYKISGVSVAGLLGYIPRRFIPPLQGFKADMQVSAVARLTSAWSFSSESFPSLSIDFKVPQGVVDYTLELPGQAAGKTSQATLSMRHSPIDCFFIFNGTYPEKSYVKIPPFRVSADGLDVTLQALVTGITESPRVVAGINVSSDIGRTLRALPLQFPFDAGGDMEISAGLEFNIPDFSYSGLASGLLDLTTSSTVDIRNLRFKAPALGVKGSLSALHAELRESASSLGSDGVVNPKAAISAALKGVDILCPSGDIRVKDMNVRSDASCNGLLTEKRLHKGIPISIEGDISSMAVNAADPDMEINLSGLSFSEKILRESGDPLTDIFNDGTSINVGLADIKTEGRRFLLRDLRASAAIIPAPEALSGGGDSIRKEKDLPETQDDAGVLPPKGLRETPELIVVNTPRFLREFMSKYSLDALLKIKSVKAEAPGFDADDSLTDIDVSVRGDTLTLANVNASIQHTDAILRGRISNLRGFLLDPPSEENPLDFDLNLALGRVDINSLSHAYVESRGGMDKIPRHDKVTPADSVSLLVPRNISAGIDLTARETIYTNLHLYDLVADIGLENGHVRIPRLGVATDFGKASLFADYAGVSPDSLRLDMGISFQDMNIVNFFRNFHSLLLMMPEMKNLSGILSANATMGARIFPDMYIDIPSAFADVTVKGRDLKVHQSKFIRKITEMMLIRTDEDILIKDIDVHAGAHDNLLQLDPFYFEFDRYKLQMLGINNFNGKLYYHIAVEKSPVPFPFSINIEGMFHRPVLRFGGPHYDTLHAERISSSIQEENKVNMMMMLRKFLRVFIGKAAESVK